MKKIVKMITGLAVILAGAAGMAAPVFAADPFCDNLPAGINREDVGCSTTEDGLPNAVVNIINWVIGAGGLVAVIYVVIGGIGYVTANGDASKLAKAKNTILYALIGLVVTALAFAIVNFAIGGIQGNTTSPSGETSEEDMGPIDANPHH